MVWSLSARPNTRRPGERRKTEVTGSLARQLEFASFGAGLLQRRAAQERIEARATRLAKLAWSFDVWQKTAAERKKHRVILRRCMLHWTNAELREAWASWCWNVRQGQLKILKKILAQWHTFVCGLHLRCRRFEDKMNVRLAERRLRKSMVQWKAVRLSSQRQWAYALNGRARPFISTRLKRVVLLRWTAWHDFHRRWKLLFLSILQRTCFRRLKWLVKMANSKEAIACSSALHLYNTRALHRTFVGMHAVVQAHREEILLSSQVRGVFVKWYAVLQSSQNARRAYVRLSTIGRLAVGCLQWWHTWAVRTWRLECRAAHLEWIVNKAAKRYFNQRERVFVLPSVREEIAKAASQILPDESDDTLPVEEEKVFMDDSSEEENTNEDTNDDFPLDMESFRKQLLQQAREERCARELSGHVYWEYEDEDGASRNDIDYAEVNVLDYEFAAHQKQRIEGPTNPRASLNLLRQSGKLDQLKSKRQQLEKVCEEQQSLRHEALMSALDHLYDKKYLSLLKRSMRQNAWARRSQSSQSSASADAYDKMQVEGYGAHHALLNYLQEVHDPRKLADLEARAFLGRPFADFRAAQDAPAFSPAQQSSFFSPSSTLHSHFSPSCSSSSSLSWSSEDESGESGESSESESEGSDESDESDEDSVLTVGRSKKSRTIHEAWAVASFSNNSEKDR